MTEDKSMLPIPEGLIAQKIFIIRNIKVMLDKDLADLFEVKATRLREQVKRNQDKFPPHFMFQLTDSEVDIMVSQNATPSKQHLGGYLPYVFREHGILQLDIEMIKNKLDSHDQDIEMIFHYLDELTEKKENQIHRNPFGFKRIDEQ